MIMKICILFKQEYWKKYIIKTETIWLMNNRNVVLMIIHSL